MVIFLNGTSSSGKTTIAKELQARYKTPYLHVGIDTFFNMIHPRFVGPEASARLGYYYFLEDGKRKITLGPYGKKLTASTVPVVAALLQQKNDLIIDEILYAGEGRDFLYKYACLFDGVTAYFIKVDCPLSVLEKREKLRKDRHSGIARAQYEHIHAHGFSYDISVDTSQYDAATCAEQIMSFIKKNPHPQAFEIIRQYLL